MIYVVIFIIILWRFHNAMRDASCNDLQAAFQNDFWVILRPFLIFLIIWYTYFFFLFLQFILYCQIASKSMNATFPLFACFILFYLSFQNKSKKISSNPPFYLIFHLFFLFFHTKKQNYLIMYENQNKSPFHSFLLRQTDNFFIQGCHILYIWARIIYAAPAISTKMGYWIFFRDPHAKRWSPNACPCRYSIPASLQQRRDMLRKSRSEQQLSYFRINAIIRASGPMCVPIAMPISCRLQPVSPNCCTVSSINCCPISALSLCANMTGIAGSAS